MVKLFAFCVLFKAPNGGVILQSAYNLQSFGFFQRGSMQEFMAFSCKTVVERTQCATRQSIQQSEYTCHVYVRGDSLAGVVISDHDYPHRVAHSLITKVLDEFSNSIPESIWSTSTESTVNFPQINAYLHKYQNPAEADAMTKIQGELDETKIILHNTLEAVLNRGEKLDDLVSKSEGLSLQSKAFYKTARKTNACCNLH